MSSRDRSPRPDHARRQAGIPRACRFTHRDQMAHQRKLRRAGMTIPVLHDHEISRRKVDCVRSQFPAGNRGRDDMLRNNGRARPRFNGLADRFIVG